MTTGDRVFWVHSEQGSPQVVRHTICQGRLIAVGNSGTAAVLVGSSGYSIWFVEASKLVLSRADAEYVLKAIQVPPTEPELCCIAPAHPVPVEPVAEMQAGAWCRPISGCEHDRKKTVEGGWECLDCGLVEVFS